MKLSEISEDQQLNELLPALGAIGGAVAKGAASAVGGAMAKGAMNLAKPAQAAGGAAKPPAPGQPPAPNSRLNRPNRWLKERKPFKSRSKKCKSRFKNLPKN
jgi:hypothetical protein